MKLIKGDLRWLIETKGGARVKTMFSSYTPALAVIRYFEERFGLTLVYEEK